MQTTTTTTAHTIVPTDGIATMAAEWCMTCDGPAEFCDDRTRADDIAWHAARSHGPNVRRMQVRAATLRALIA